MANVPYLGLRTHSQKVCSLYKRAVRNVEAWYDVRYVFRYHAVSLRARFDKNAKVTNMITSTQMLVAGEEELFSVIHAQPRKFANSPGGVAYARVVDAPDWVLDYWHPLEKAQYPEYFKRRELRKKVFMAQWETKYGKPDPKDLEH